MSALWGTPAGADRRPLRARCEECDWEGKHHFDADADAVIKAAHDSHAHNVAVHESATDRQPATAGMLF